jgi:hypothetical protein
MWHPDPICLCRLFYLLEKLFFSTYGFLNYSFSCEMINHNGDTCSSLLVELYSGVEKVTYAYQDNKLLNPYGASGTRHGGTL